MARLLWSADDASASAPSRKIAGATPKARAFAMLARRAGEDAPSLGRSPAALRADAMALGKVANGSKTVSASLALRVARLLDVPFDDLLLGRYKPGACPKCGHRPQYLPVYASDFTDETTTVEDVSRLPSDGLKLVK